MSLVDNDRERPWLLMVRVGTMHSGLIFAGKASIPRINPTSTEYSADLNWNASCWLSLRIMRNPRSFKNCNSNYVAGHDRFRGRYLSSRSPSGLQGLWTYANKLMLLFQSQKERTLLWTWLQSPLLMNRWRVSRTMWLSSLVWIPTCPWLRSGERISTELLPIC